MVLYKIINTFKHLICIKYIWRIVIKPHLRTSEVWLESRGWECLLCRSSSDCTEDTWRCKEAWGTHAHMWETVRVNIIKTFSFNYSCSNNNNSSTEQQQWTNNHVRVSEKTSTLKREWTVNKCNISHKLLWREHKEDLFLKIFFSLCSLNSTTKERSQYLEEERTLILSLWTGWPEPVRKWASFNSGDQVAKGQRLLQEVRNLFMGLHTVCTLALSNTNRKVTNSTMVLWIPNDRQAQEWNRTRFPQFVHIGTQVSIMLILI